MRIARNLALVMVGTLLAAVAFAHDPAAAAAGGSASDNAWYAIAAAIAIGLPALGGAFGQGRASAAALEGIARNPGASGKLFVPMILGLVLIESLVIYGLVIAFSVFGKIQ
ncbi:MAG: ATP synthase F0 subunit C [Deltaproteobacteria bacterium]|nr:ATP synthase F0 subunit C [Deltaproteobacteria bacterium]